MRFSTTVIMSLGLVSLAIAQPVYPGHKGEMVCSDSGCTAIGELAHIQARSLEEYQELNVSTAEVAAQADEAESSGLSARALPDEDDHIEKDTVEDEEEEEGETASANTTENGIEKRQVMFAIEVAANIIPLAVQADKSVQNIINQDIRRRQQFTQQTVTSLKRKFPSLNFVMSNVGYSFSGHVVAKKTVFYHNKIGRKVSFDVIGFRKGDFVLKGDGGFQNWAFIGTRCSTNGKHVHC